MRFRVLAWAFAVFAIVSSTLCFARGNREINQWQKAIVDIGHAIMESDRGGPSWTVEYNSNFSAAEIGYVLAPTSYDRNTSSLNVIAKCAPASAAPVDIAARDFAAFASNRAIGFGAKASPPPDFLTGSLATVNASLGIDNSRQVSFSLTDAQVRQIMESDAIDAINASECIRRIRHRRDVFYVRGQYLMRLVMSQHRAGTGNLGAALGLGGTNSNFGFGVRWNRALDWEIAQTRPRPWFRIVSHFRRNRDGTAYEIMN